MRLRANVRKSTGLTRHLVHGAESIDIAPQIAWVELAAADGAFNLFYFDHAGTCVADGWHETEQLAKAQARFEFEIDDQDWNVVEDDAR